MYALVHADPNFIPLLSKFEALIQQLADWCGYSSVDLGSIWKTKPSAQGIPWEKQRGVHRKGPPCCKEYTCFSPFGKQLGKIESSTVFGPIVDIAISQFGGDSTYDHSHQSTPPNLAIFPGNIGISVLVLTTLNSLDNNGARTLNWINISRGPAAFASDFRNYQGSRRDLLEKLTEKQIKRMNDATIQLDFYASSKMDLLAACVKVSMVMKVIKEHIPEGQGKVSSSMTSRSSGQAPSSVSRPDTFAEVAKAGAGASTSTSTSSKILGQSSSVLRES